MFEASKVWLLGKQLLLFSPQLPKTFVNLVQTVDITRLARLDSTLICRIIHSCVVIPNETGKIVCIDITHTHTHTHAHTHRWVCPCPTTGSNGDKKQVKEAAAQYQVRTCSRDLGAITDPLTESLPSSGAVIYLSIYLSTPAKYLGPCQFRSL